MATRRLIVSSVGASLLLNYLMPEERNPMQGRLIRLANLQHLPEDDTECPLH